MPLYRCAISDSDGKLNTKTVSAANREEIIRMFAGTSVQLIDVQEISVASHTGKQFRRAVLEFTDIMNLLLNAGLSIRDALEIAASIGKKSKSGQIAKDLLESVRKGQSFAQAVESRPHIFPTLYRGMVKVGDSVGSIERIFPRLASYLKDKKTLQDKLAEALSYPLLVLVVACMGTLGLVFFVIPRMERIFESFGSAATQQIRHNIYTMKIGLIIGCGSIAFILITLILLLGIEKHNRKIKKTIDLWILLMPIIGRFVSSWETMNFAFSMEILASGGVPVETSLNEAATVISNCAYQDALLEIRKQIMKGQNLSAAFASHREFPTYLSDWITIGERSGKTEQIFSHIRSYFQSEVEQYAARFMTLIEPALIIIIGIVMLILITGLVIPLFSLYGTIL